MSTLLHNGLRVVADDETGRIFTVKSLDGGFHFFHVCCGCHKVHEAHFYVKDEGNTLVSEWELPLPEESTKIVAGLPPALEKDLIVYELANFRAAEEIKRLKQQLVAANARTERCDCGKTMEACEQTEDCDGQSMPSALGLALLGKRKRKAKA